MTTRVERMGALLGLLLFLLAGRSLAQEPEYPWLRFEQTPGAESSIPADKRTLSADWRDELAAEDHAIADVFRRTTIELQPGGKLTERAIFVRQLLSPTGVRNHGRLRHWVRPSFSRVTVEEAWVQLPDGRIVDFDLSTLQVQSDSDPALFSDGQVLNFEFSHLEPGATIALVIREENDLDRWPLPWARYWAQLLIF